MFNKNIHLTHYMTIFELDLQINHMFLRYYRENQEQRAHFYSMLTSCILHIMLIGYAILQTNYEIQRQKDCKKQLLIFWFIFSIDILIENYFAKDKFNLIRYTKFLICTCLFYVQIVNTSFHFIIIQFVNNRKEFDYIYIHNFYGFLIQQFIVQVFVN
ncbi:unnamed protein product [Paramecium sonneborni]|uniref:Transmembrane protein n=1 Tax=Paramecium sonneborni TaxID=65129 RepID=A0A8S1MXN9_9CILI|nr:unnamed protein product [Paramecium sonneborni]